MTTGMTVTVTVTVRSRTTGDVTMPVTVTPERGRPAGAPGRPSHGGPDNFRLELKRTCIFNLLSSRARCRRPSLPGRGRRALNFGRLVGTVAP